MLLAAGEHRAQRGEICLRAAVYFAVVHALAELTPALFVEVGAQIFSATHGDVLDEPCARKFASCHTDHTRFLAELTRQETAIERRHKFARG